MLFRSLAQLALEAGRADLAGELLRRGAAPPAPVAEPADHLHALGIRHLQAGRWADAERHLQAALRARPEVGSWHDHLGVVYASQKRYAEAEVTFRLAARLDPDNPSPARNLIQACLDQKRWPEALEAIELGRRADPASRDWPLQRAVVLGELKRYAEAEALLMEVVERGEATGAVWNRLGVVRGLGGRPEAAIACFEEQIGRAHV